MDSEPEKRSIVEQIMRSWIVQSLIIILLAGVIALATNGIRSQGIALVGNWPARTASGEGPITPPSAQPGDPPFITLDDAAAKYQIPGVIFIDARLPEDYAAGHIERAVNIPFDALDESWFAVIDSLNKTAPYVIYCSGGECESSLFLGRIMQERGFSEITVFFGGWQEWVDNQLPVTGGES